jgi:hypothetical protein
MEAPRTRLTWGPELRHTRQPPLLEPVPRRTRLPLLLEPEPRHTRLPLLLEPVPYRTRLPRECVQRRTRLPPVRRLRRIPLPRPGRISPSSYHAADYTPRGNRECSPRSQ